MIQTHFLMIVKNTVTPEGSCTDYVSVGQDISLLGVDDEPGRLAAHGKLGVEGARLTEVYGHDALHHPFDRCLPLGRVCLGWPHGQHGCFVLLIFDIVDGAVGRSAVSGGQGRRLGLEMLRWPIRCCNGTALAFGTGLTVLLHAEGGREEPADESGGVEPESLFRER